MECFKNRSRPVLQWLLRFVVISIQLIQKKSLVCCLHKLCSEHDILELMWCACESCQIMGRVEACKCCQEIEHVKSKLTEAVTCECNEEPTCITQDPGFHPVCINRWVLRQRGFSINSNIKILMKGQNTKLFRHIAYRQLARWCWGILGKEIRVVLPCHLVRFLCISSFYPPPGP